MGKTTGEKKVNRQEFGKKWAGGLGGFQREERDACVKWLVRHGRMRGRTYEHISKRLSISRRNT